jgi:hypothetical protein
MVWTFVYRDGPIQQDDLAHRMSLGPDALDSALESLTAAGRDTAKQQDEGILYTSAELVIRADANVGWEAAVLDHFQALVRTIVAKLRRQPADAEWQGLIGGSTYTFVVWPGHPHYAEACDELASFRGRRSNLRTRVDAYNAEHGIPKQHQRIVSYYGQCIVADESEERDEG